MPLVCPSWLLCCLLSSPTSRPAAPPSVHLLLRCHLSSCRSFFLVFLPLFRPGYLSCHFSSCRHLPYACASTSHLTATSHRAPLVPLVLLVVVLLLIMPTPPVCCCLQLLLHHRLLLCPSCVLSTLAGCRVASNVVLNGLRSCRHCKEMQAKTEHLFVRVLGCPN